MLNTRLFSAKEYPLQIYNGKALIDFALRFFTVIDCDGMAYEEIDFDFPDYVSSYFRVYNERSGRLILDLSLERSGGYLIVNANAEQMTFEDNGNYYYEVGYSRGGYEQALRYGTLSVI
ncbi:MAG: hypothetical protein QOA70_08155 [Nitrososphaeraceae archaeon]|nr:hypothetical protein [Nitrososphaeraceae archaeon]